MDLNKTLIGVLVEEYGLELKGLRIFKEYNQEGRLVLLLDAFDEMVARIGPEFALAAFEQIEKMITPRSKVVVSLRTHYFRSKDEIQSLASDSSLRNHASERGYQVCEVQPLTEAQIREYLEHAAPQYMIRLLENPRLKELATRPLLLNMITVTLLDLVGRQRLTVGQLFHTYTDKWLGRDRWRCRMNVDQRRLFCERLAESFANRGVSAIHYTQLQAEIRDQFRELDRFRELEYFDVDVRTSSFLTRDSNGNYGFAHKSFYEFFLACRIVSDPDVVRRIGRDKLHEPAISEALFDVLGARLNRLDDDAAGELLTLLFQITCANEPILMGMTRQWRHPLNAEQEERLNSFTQALLNRVVSLFQESGTNGKQMIVFRYQIENRPSTCRVAVSPGWIPRRLEPALYRPDEGVRVVVTKAGRCEYKYISGDTWEAGENRWIEAAAGTSSILRDWPR